MIRPNRSASHAVCKLNNDDIVKQDAESHSGKSNSDLLKNNCSAHPANNRRRIGAGSIKDLISFYEMTYGGFDTKCNKVSSSSVSSSKVVYSSLEKPDRTVGNSYKEEMDRPNPFRFEAEEATKAQLDSTSINSTNEYSLTGPSSVSSSVSSSVASMGSSSSPCSFSSNNKNHTSDEEDLANEVNEKQQQKIFKLNRENSEEKEEEEEEEEADINKNSNHAKNQNQNHDFVVEENDDEAKASSSTSSNTHADFNKNENENKLEITKASQAQRFLFFSSQTTNNNLNEIIRPVVNNNKSSKNKSNNEIVRLSEKSSSDINMPLQNQQMQQELLPILPFANLRATKEENYAFRIVANNIGEEGENEEEETEKKTSLALSKGMLYFENIYNYNRRKERKKRKRNEGI